METINSKYFTYIPTSEFEKSINEMYSEDKFKRDYKNNPNRMTAEQIRLNGGYDSLYDSLWQNFINDKYACLHSYMVVMANGVMEQMAKPIKEILPNVHIEFIKGEIKDDYNRTYEMPRIIIGDTKHEYLCIHINLPEFSKDCFEICYYTKYADDIVRNCTDEELLNELKAFGKYLKDGKYPTIGINKVHYLYDNQYVIYFGDSHLRFYDIEIVNLYNRLAKEMNNKFDTHYEYSQKIIDNLYKHSVFGNIHHIGEVTLDSYFGSWELDIASYYDDNTKIVSNYGHYTKEELINLLNIIEPYIKSNYFIETSAGALNKKYDSYNKIGIKYDERPTYFIDMVWGI